MSIYNDIRAALETQLGTTTGIPAAGNRVFDGMEYSPAVGTAYMSASLVPVSGRPQTLGQVQILHQGLFNVTLFYPANPTQRTAAETLADSIKEKFKVDVTLSKNSTRVRMRFAERGQARVDGGWIVLPITISWYVFSESY